MSDRLLVLYLQFTDQHHLSGLRTLRALSSRLFPSHRQSVLVVDNALLRSQEEQVDSEVNVISGDNRWREFSGYDRGIRWFESFGLIPSTTPVLIANDTFHRSYGDGYLDLFRREQAQESVRSGSVMGYVDAFPERITLFGSQIQKWVRTSLLLLPYGTLVELLPFTPAIQSDAVFLPGVDSRFFRDDAPLSQNYKDFLRSWLFAPIPEGAAFREEWHSKERLTAENAQAMREKAGCIFAEHLLSARIQDRRIPILAVNQAQLNRAGVGG